MLHTRFPRELRDGVYGAMYTQDDPIIYDDETWRHGSNWPKDPSRFLTRSIVGDDTAKEAAHIFYACNRFAVDDASHLEYFGRDDHYRSGLEPCSVVQQLTIAINHSSDYDYDLYDSGEFQHRPNPPNIYSYLTVMDGMDSNERMENRDGLRHELEILEECPKLKNLQIYILENISTGLFDPRDIAKRVFDLKEQGTKVVVRYGVAKLELEPNAVSGGNTWLDISSVFEPPTDSERESYKKGHPGLNWKLETVNANKLYGLGDENVKAGSSPPWFQFPCRTLSKSTKCRRQSNRDCSDRSWHLGWYRAMLEDHYTVLKQMRESGTSLPCEVCEDNPANMKHMSAWVDPVDVEDDPELRSLWETC